LRGTLRELILNNTSLSDKGLLSVVKLDLFSLSIDSCPLVTDLGLAVIATM